MKLTLYIVAGLAFIFALGAWLTSSVTDEQAEEDAEAMSTNDPIDLRHLL